MTGSRSPSPTHNLPPTNTSTDYSPPTNLRPHPTTTPVREHPTDNQRIPRSKAIPPLSSVSMPWQLVLSLFHVNINSMDIQGNPLLNITGNGGTYISQANSTGHVQATPIHHASDHDADFQPFSTAVMDRRVETQLRIRRKLDEACERPGSIYGIDIVARAAKDILAVIEGCPPHTFSDPFINLAMNAHATAYIALISCLYRFDAEERRIITRASVRKLRRFLARLQSLLSREARQRGVIARIKMVFSKGRKNKQVLQMQEELLDILRDMEKNENASVLASLDIALGCPYQ